MTDPKQALQQALAQYQDPYLQQDLISSNAIKAIQVNANSIEIDLMLAYPAAGIREQYQLNLAEYLHKQTGLKNIHVHLHWEIASYQVQAGLNGVKNIKNIIAVGSGKGGVGKSTVSVNLALALAAEGAKVGILDADIYGPSQPQMLGSYNPPESKDQKTIQPIERHGIQSMSIGYLVDINTAVIWRGPMVSSALQQLLQDTQWQNLDYLIVDLPPGTGDIQLTLAQKIPVAGAVVITTPQDLSLLDARRAINMFNKVNIPVLGVVENMSHYTCPHCGHQENLFGCGGGQKLATESETELLAQLPLDIRIREQTDSGTPPVAADPKSPIAEQYRELARKVAAKLSLRSKRFPNRFPKIVIENT